jgi:hypothetical protein
MYQAINGPCMRQHMLTMLQLQLFVVLSQPLPLARQLSSMTWHCVADNCAYEAESDTVT